MTTSFIPERQTIDLTSGGRRLQCLTYPYIEKLECEIIMPTASLTMRIDMDLKTELEQIARFDRRSASFMTNQAIKNLVEERKATRELIQTGLSLVKAGAATLSGDQIHEWFMDDEEASFPQSKTFE